MLTQRIARDNEFAFPREGRSLKIPDNVTLLLSFSRNDYNKTFAQSTLVICGCISEAIAMFYLRPVDTSCRMCPSEPCLPFTISPLYFVRVKVNKLYRLLVGTYKLDLL